MKMKLKITVLIILVFLLVGSCNNGQLLGTLLTEELFTIPLGKMEDQFDFFINNKEDLLLLFNFFYN